MKYQFFTVPVVSPQDEQEKLNLFCSQHRIVDVDKQIIMQGNTYFWVFCISYMDAAMAEVSKNKQSNRKRIDYKEVLNEVDFNKYVELRNLRKEIAEQNGIPVYAVFTNEHLATMVQQRITTLIKLQAIDGIGESRLEKYGEAFITCLIGLFNEKTAH